MAKSLSALVKREIMAGDLVMRLSLLRALYCVCNLSLRTHGLPSIENEICLRSTATSMPFPCQCLSSSLHHQRQQYETPDLHVSSQLEKQNRDTTCTLLITHEEKNPLSPTMPVRRATATRVKMRTVYA